MDSNPATILPLPPPLSFMQSKFGNPDYSIFLYSQAQNLKCPERMTANDIGNAMNITTMEFEN